MTKLCARGKSAAKRKFKVYPSAYANAYASKICAGKIKDPSGTKRKDWGPKKMSVGGINTASHMKAMKDARAKTKKVAKALHKASGLHKAQAKTLETIKVKCGVAVNAGGRSAMGRLEKSGIVRGGGAAIRGLNFQGVK